MVFNSLTFGVFLVVVLALRLAPQISWKNKKRVLLVASYLFYSAWNPPLVALLWLSTVVDWVLARRMAGASSRRRRWLLAASLVVNLGMLAAFKYGQFLTDSMVAGLGLVGIDLVPVDLGIFLPIGISFYTFQTLSWTFDVYRGTLDPRGVSLSDFALFVAFFPQLVAGPIVRASDFLPQLDRESVVHARDLGWGATLLVVGLFEKIVAADQLLSPVSDLAFARSDALSTTEAWIGALAFSGQIFFDFAGYSTCAIGVAMMLGFGLPDNFRFPYAAVGLSDFWRRWHISLSSWLRDYLYIPLGGNRKGKARRHLNLMTTMLLGGLWHGAAWTFVFWGFLHGAYLIAEQILGRLPAVARPRLLAYLATQVAVLVAWVPFRAPSFEVAWNVITAMFGAGAGTRTVLTTSSMALVAGLTAALYAGHYAMRNATLEDVSRRLPRAARALVIASATLAIVTSEGGNRAFIYFQF